MCQPLLLRNIHSFGIYTHSVRPGDIGVDFKPRVVAFSAIVVKDSCNWVKCNIGGCNGAGIINFEAPHSLDYSWVDQCASVIKGVISFDVNPVTEA